MEFSHTLFSLWAFFGPKFFPDKVFGQATPWLTLKPNSLFILYTKPNHTLGVALHAYVLSRLV
jgi:hypothetical protein